MNNLCALVIIIPIMGGLFYQIIGRKSILFLWINLLVVILLGNLVLTQGEIHYHFGDWEVPLGIQLKADLGSVFCILWLSICAILFQNKESNNLLMICHGGVSGLLLTMDIFNMYVFIEVISLTSYALIIDKKNKRSLISAFEYLIVGTIGATFFLLGVGIIFANTGSLSINDINFENSKMIFYGVMLIMSGCFIKLGCWPSHAWIIRVYEHANTSALIYLSGVSGFTNVLILYKLCKFPDLFYVTEAVGILSAIFGSLISCRNKDKIVFGSIIGNSGFVLCLLSIPNTIGIAIFYLLVDHIHKISLLTATREKNGVDWIFKINLLSNAGIPLTIGFIAKVIVLSTLLENDKYAAFFGLLFASALSIFYTVKALNIKVSKGAYFINAFVFLCHCMIILNLSKISKIFIALSE